MPNAEAVNPTVNPNAPVTAVAPAGFHFVTLASGARVLRADGSQGVSSNIPGKRELWKIDGKLYLVWKVPVDADGDGQFDETVPIAFAASEADLRNAGLGASPVHTITGEEWDALGGLEMGSILELDNTDANPFDGFVATIQRQAELYPHLLDPGVMAVTAAAWLMGRPVTDDDLARTDWWQTHSIAERNWLLAATRDPATASATITDNRLWAAEQLRNAGVANAPEELINLIADMMTRGTWSSNYTLNQIRLLADPALPGTLDPLVSNYLSGTTGFTLDTTTSRLDTVKAMVKKWLGPTFGNWTDAQFNDWAGRLRNDPDAAQSLEDMLSHQRLAMFPAYRDPTLTYDDISAPWRGLFQQVWGEIPDETDPFFTKIVNMNDAWEARKVLSKEGLTRGIRTVTESALRDMYSSFGGGSQVVRAQ